MKRLISPGGSAHLWRHVWPEVYRACLNNQTLAPRRLADDRLFEYLERSARARSRKFLEARP